MTLTLSFCILSHDSRFAEVMHSMGLQSKLLFELSDPSVSIGKVKIISGVITCLLKAHFTLLDINRYSLETLYCIRPSQHQTL